MLWRNFDNGAVSIIQSLDDGFDGLMCDSAERLICGTMSNVFVVRDQSISTPDLGRCGVAGVMKRVAHSGIEECAS